MTEKNDYKIEEQISVLPIKLFKFTLHPLRIWNIETHNDAGIEQKQYIYIFNIVIYYRIYQKC